MGSGSSIARPTQNADPSSGRTISIARHVPFYGGAILHGQWDRVVHTPELLTSVSDFSSRLVSFSLRWLSDASDAVRWRRASMVVAARGPKCPRPPPLPPPPPQHGRTKQHTSLVCLPSAWGRSLRMRHAVGFTSYLYFLLISPRASRALVSPRQWGKLLSKCVLPCADLEVPGTWGIANSVRNTLTWNAA